MNLANEKAHLDDGKELEDEEVEEWEGFSRGDLAEADDSSDLD